MRKIFFLIFITIFLGLRPSATVISTTDLTFFPKTITSKETKNIASLKIKDIQKMLGRKLSLREKIAILILKQRLKHKARENSQPGNTALIFGIGGAALLVLGLFLAPLLIGSLIASIIAIVIGSVAKKKHPSDGKAHAAVLLGWITLILLAILLLAAAIVVSTWSWF
jgi:hypothetical protein